MCAFGGYPGHSQLTHTHTCTTIEANGLLWGMELKASTWPFERVAWFKALLFPMIAHNLPGAKGCPNKNQ